MTTPANSPAHVLLSNSAHRDTALLLLLTAGWVWAHMPLLVDVCDKSGLAWLYLRVTFVWTLQDTPFTTKVRWFVRPLSEFAADPIERSPSVTMAGIAANCGVLTSMALTPIMKVGLQTISLFDSPGHSVY